MKKNILAVFYAVPFAYAAMAVDFIKGSILSYVLMMVFLSLLSRFFFIRKKLLVPALGNAASFIASFLCAVKIPLEERWYGFFKPLTPVGMIIFLTFISLIVQLIVLIAIRKKE